MHRLLRCRLTPSFRTFLALRYRHISGSSDYATAHQTMELQVDDSFISGEITAELVAKVRARA
jgi:hypothetical protein